MHYMKNGSDGYIMVGNQIVYEPNFTSKTEIESKRKFGVDKCSVDLFNRTSHNKFSDSIKNKNSKRISSIYWKNLYSREVPTTYRQKNTVKTSSPIRISKKSSSEFKKLNNMNMSAYETTWSGSNQSFRRTGMPLSPTEAAGKLLFDKIDKYILKMKESTQK